MSVQTEATGPVRGKTQERIQRAAEGLLVAEEPPSDRVSPHRWTFSTGTSRQQICSWTCHFVLCLKAYEA
jgi:hypothetical protein